jgi:Flp pilus assembly protein TadD
VACARKAMKLCGGQDAKVVFTLAVALAESGRFAEAQSTARQALALAAKAVPNAANAQLTEKIKRFLETGTI